jgi:hypothetical protein
MLHLLWVQALQQQANQERALEAQILLQHKQEQQRHINERQQQENFFIASHHMTESTSPGLPM